METAEVEALRGFASRAAVLSQTSARLQARHGGRDEPVRVVAIPDGPRVFVGCRSDWTRATF